MESSSSIACTDFRCYRWQGVYSYLMEKQNILPLWKKPWSSLVLKANSAAKKQYQQAQTTQASRQPDLPNLWCICALKALSPFKCSFWYHVSESRAHPFEPDFLHPLGLCGYSPASSQHIAVCRWKKQMFSGEHSPHTTRPKPPSTLYLK